jgi:16S rRNA (adenine1518-N6/adenine1519-N6)-dimethyltransferase
MDRYKKSLGQNFLHDKNVIIKLLKSVPQNMDILEIGTGSGNLTIELAKHTNNNIKSYEIDPLAYQEAKERLTEYTNVQLFLENFLTAEIDTSIPLIVVANIPYNITAPIIEKCVELKNIKNIYLMVQKELAERIIAQNSTKNYSSFSIFCQTRAICKKLFNVSATCFIPQPKVESTYLQLTPISKYIDAIKDINKYNKIVRSAFWGKRKTLINCLQKSPYITFEKEHLFQVFEELKISNKIRGQELYLTEFIKISNLLK